MTDKEKLIQFNKELNIQSEWSGVYPKQSLHELGNGHYFVDAKDHSKSNRGIYQKTNKKSRELVGYMICTNFFSGEAVPFKPDTPIRRIILYFKIDWKEQQEALADLM